MKNVALACPSVAVLLAVLPAFGCGTSGSRPLEGTGTAGRGGASGSGGELAGASGTTGNGGAGGSAGTGGGSGAGGGAGSGGAGGSIGGTSAGGQGGASICDGFAIPDDHPNAATAYETTADTVTDRVTGLMWQRIVAETDAFSIGAPPCRRPQLGGFSDWRPPTAIELTTIVDLAAFNPAIDTTTFPGAPVWFFGTSTGVYGHASNNNNWTVDLKTGMTMNGTTTKNYARCVRRATPQTCYTAPRFQVSTSPAGVEVIVDAQTNLTWQRGVAPAPVTWDDAKPYCASLGGSFRLPSAKELLSLVDWTTRRAIDASLFPVPATTYELFWTGTAYAGDASYAVTVSFGDATYTGTTPALTTEAHPVRCVM